MPVHDCQIGVRIEGFGREFGTNFIRLDPGKITLAGAQADEDELVVFTTLELECPAVCPIGKDALPDFLQKKGTFETRRISSGQGTNDLSEEAPEVLHA